METTTQLNRQARGCGYEPPAPAGVRVMPWSPPLSKLGFKHKQPTVCVGYTVKLPEVAEVARAHAHWTRGSLQAFCGRDLPTENLLAMIEILDGEAEHVKAYSLTSKADGGGRDP